MIAPSIFVAALALQNGAPDDVPFGRYVRDSGLAAPLVLLTFGSIWLFPLIASLVAGDIVAAEDGNGTLKTILTRSVDARAVVRGQGRCRGHLRPARARRDGGRRRSRRRRSPGASTRSRASRARPSRPGADSCWCSPASASTPLPLLAITAIGVLLSTVTRNSAGAVVGALMIALLMQLIGILPGVGAIKPYLLTTQFDAWHGFLRTPIDWAPIMRGGWVSAVYAAVALAAAYLVFLRRDVAGG